MDLQSNPFESAKSAFAELLQGDAGGVGRAVFQPATLSPEERKSASKRYLGEKEGPLAAVLEMASNPMVLAGLALTAAYPVAHASRLLKFGDKLSHYAKKHFPGMMALMDFRQIFGGRLGNIFDDIVRTTHGHKTEWSARYGYVFDKYQKMGGSFDETSLSKVAASMDGLDRSSHDLWGLARTKLNPAMSRLLVPQRLALTKAEQYLKGEMRHAMRKEFDAAIGGARAADTASIRAALKDAGLEPGLDKTIKHYFPRIETMDRDALQARTQAWVSKMSASRGGSSNVAAMEQAGHSVTKVHSKSMAKRGGIMLPSESGMKAAGLWNDDVARAYKQLDALNVDKATGAYLGQFRRYGLSLPKTTENYSRGMAQTKGWSMTRPGGERSPGQMVKEELELVASADPVKANMLKETYIPLVSGRLSWEQAVDSLRFSQTKMWAAHHLKKLPIPKSTKDFLMRPLAEDSGVTWHRMGSAIQNYLYTSTLGLNVVSPMKNALQSVLTTYPVLGKYTGRGLSETLKRTNKYYGMKAKGHSSQDSFKKSFPEIAGTDFDITGLTHEGGFEDALDAAYHEAFRLPSKTKRTIRQLEEKALTLFTASERLNRFTSFYGGYYKYVDEMVGHTVFDDLIEKSVVLTKGSPQLVEQAAKFGEQITKMTQYGGGPMGAPSSIVKWWGPARQFMQFPMRTLGFAVGPATRLGGEGGRNFGTLGRMMAAGGITYEAGKAAGVDVSDALMFGAMPQAGNEDSPFGIVPLVPPLVQIIGQGASAAVKGDIEELKDAIPLLTPGGVQLSRMTTAGAPAIAEWMGRNYADYETPTQDGRVPIYSRGQLVGYQSPTSLWLKSIGISNFDAGTELAATRYILGQREKVRGFRREFVDSLMANDLEGVRRVKAQWKDQYPGLGDLYLKKSDVRAAQMRQIMPRIEQILKTLPPEYREQFSQIVATSMGAGAHEFLGGDISLMANTTRANANSMRPSRALRQMSMPFGQQEGSGQLATQFGETMRDRLSDRGFSTLDGYQ